MAALRLASPMSDFWGRPYLVSPRPGHFSNTLTARSGWSLDLRAVSPVKEARWLPPCTVGLWKRGGKTRGARRTQATEARGSEGLSGPSCLRSPRGGWRDRSGEPGGAEVAAGAETAGTEPEEPRSLSSRGHLSHFPKLPGRGGTAAPETALLRPAPRRTWSFSFQPRTGSGCPHYKRSGTGARRGGGGASRGRGEVPQIPSPVFFLFPFYSRYFNASAHLCPMVHQQAQAPPDWPLLRLLAFFALFGPGNSLLAALQRCPPPVSSEPGTARDCGLRASTRPHRAGRQDPSSRPRPSRATPATAAASRPSPCLPHGHRVCSLGVLPRTLLLIPQSSASVACF